MGGLARSQNLRNRQANTMKWYPPKPEKPKPCARCRRGRRVIGPLCGFCYAEDVRHYEERSRRSRLVVGGAGKGRRRP